MPLEVAVYARRNRRRSKVLASAMINGIHRCGDIPRFFEHTQYQGPAYRIAVFYGAGQADGMGKLLSDYRALADQGYVAIHMDLGYWGRKHGGTFAGYHKIAVNARHPTAYFQRRKHPGDRARTLGLRAQPAKSRGAHILLAGMSEKSAIDNGFAGAEVWERQAVAEIRKRTDRPIIYRPKPSWPGARPIEGVEYSPPDQPLNHVLERAHCVVTHHSNVAGDGYLLGVPAFCWEGVGSTLASQDWDLIDNPRQTTIEERQQWVNDVAYCQWKPEEMKRGDTWRHLKDEGLVP